jgi:hypothetical protein
MDQLPIARHFVACLAIEPSPGGRGVTLRELIHAIVRMPGEPFPCLRERMALFALLTDGRGMNEFTIQLARFDRGEEQLVRPPWGPARRDLGQDPTAVHGLPVTLTNIVFPAAGQYAFHLLCNGQRLAEEKIQVR